MPTPLAVANIENHEVNANKLIEMAMQAMAEAVEELSQRQRQAEEAISELSALKTVVAGFARTATQAKEAKTDLERQMALSLLVTQVLAVSTDEADDAPVCSTCDGHRRIHLDHVSPSVHCPDCFVEG